MTVLIRLLYASKVSPNFGPMDMRDILASSRRNNVEHGITGLLIMADGFSFRPLRGIVCPSTQLMPGFLKTTGIPCPSS
jgi:hypothetical protein